MFLEYVYLIFFCLGEISSFVAGFMILFLLVQFVRGKRIILIMRTLNALLLVSSIAKLFKTLISLDTKDLMGFLGSVIMVIVFFFIYKKSLKNQ